MASGVADTGLTPQLRFAQRTGAHVALFGSGPGDGAADFDDFVYRCGAWLADGAWHLTDVIR